MASNYWAKLWIEMLDDPKVARLGDHLWRRFMEMILLGKERDERGFLPSVPDMAWRMRCSDESMLADLQALEVAGLLELRDGLWFVTNFAEQQASMGRYINPTWWPIRFAILQRDVWACRYCGGVAEHVDHVIPRCQGGTDDFDNLVASCAACNQHKGGRTPEQAGMKMING